MLNAPMASSALGPKFKVSVATYAIRRAIQRLARAPADEARLLYLRAIGFGPF